jgi:CheY-like chemotaxis protein
MDMQMPVMDGLAATRTIRERERAKGLPRTPIISLPANDMPEHARASAQSGADGHLTKAISAEALLRALAEAASGCDARGERRKAQT